MIIALLIKTIKKMIMMTKTRTMKMRCREIRIAEVLNLMRMMKLRSHMGLKV